MQNLGGGEVYVVWCVDALSIADLKAVALLIDNLYQNFKGGRKKQGVNAPPPK